jgi:hypothetical protein
VINALLVRWAKGWHEVFDQPAIDLNGRHEGTLSLGVEQSVAEVERVATGQLAVTAREEIAVDLAPMGPGDTPYAAFGVADTVTVPGLAGGPTQERVTALTVAEDENGQLSWVPELKDVLLTHNERMEQAIQRMANGALGGTSAVASPMPNLVTPAPIPRSDGGGPPPVGGAAPLAVFGGVTSIPQYNDVSLQPTDVHYANGADSYFSYVFEPASGEWTIHYPHAGVVLWGAHFDWATSGTPAGQIWSHLDATDVDGFSLVVISQGPYDMGPVLPNSQPAFGYGDSRAFATSAYTAFHPYAYQDFSAAAKDVRWSMWFMVLDTTTPT